MNSSDWGYDALAFARWRPEYGYFPKQAGFTAQTPASLSALWQVVNRLGGKEGYFFRQYFVADARRDGPSGGA